MSTAAGINEIKSLQGLTRLMAERSVQLLITALIIALSLDSALILSRLLSAPAALPAVSARSGTLPLHPTVNPQLLLATIVNAHLYGTSAALASGGEAPATTMPLVLAGVIADRDPARGQAIIGENISSAKLYSVNALVPGGARLHAVYGDRVLLERNGGLETLRLPRTSLPGAAPSALASAALRTSVRDNPSLLAGLVRVQPVFLQGKLSGYRIFPGGANGTAAFNQLGLKPGDLIIAVNGTTLDDPARAMEILQTLSSSGSATVTVSRNGTSQEVNLNLANLGDSDSDAEAGQAAAPAPSPLPPPLPMRRRPGSPLPQTTGANRASGPAARVAASGICAERHRERSAQALTVRIPI